METFLPYPSFTQSAQVLDYKRLGKQRVEAMQLLNGLLGKAKSGWMNHPAAKMWRGYEEALGLYMNMMIMEWKRRGYKNTMEYYISGNAIVMPPWFGDEDFHSSHRSNLLRKNPEFYGQYGWMDDPSKPYIWPVQGVK